MICWSNNVSAARMTSPIARTRRRLGQTGKITGQALDYLSAAPCAQSLVSLGLRNRHSIGHLNLRALGTQVREAVARRKGWGLREGGQIGRRGARMGGGSMSSLCSVHGAPVLPYV